MEVFSKADRSSVAVPAAFFAAGVGGDGDVVEGGECFEVRGHLSSCHLLAWVRRVSRRRRRGGPLRRVWCHYRRGV